ncbi:hypothetical protein [Methylobacterium indicum]|uniref:hypothetical protein n=1 Tax=Methylobacterium indicum TaxID=1775910 RepID=UPI002435E5DD|nr:hypothetical protein [Methylobacterium indicum]
MPAASSSKWGSFGEKPASLPSLSDRRLPFEEIVGTLAKIRTSPMGIEQALSEEIADLERELRDDPRFRKLRALRAALALYQPDSASVQGGHGPNNQFDAHLHSRGATATVYLGETKRKPGRQRDPERQRALDEAVSFVRNYDGMPTTADVYDHLVSLGIKIGGQSPAGNLSAMLYKDGRLTSHGRAGWSFGPPSTNNPEPEEGFEENEPSDELSSDGSDDGLDDEGRALT